MKKRAAYSVLRLVAKKRYFGIWQGLYKLSLRGMNIGMGGNFEHSGELTVLKLIKKLGANEVLFDVGANVGMYTKELVRLFPNAKIHSFEPSKDTFNTLRSNVAERNVRLNNMGISDKREKCILYSDKANSGLASLYDRQLDYFGIYLSNREEVELITLDEYCETNKIKSIDFLKMDIEGNEYKALIGASKLLESKNIKVIQIETGGGT